MSDTGAQAKECPRSLSSVELNARNRWSASDGTLEHGQSSSPFFWTLKGKYFEDISNAVKPHTYTSGAAVTVFSWVLPTHIVRAVS
jgi:hypothetical protein